MTSEYDGDAGDARTTQCALCGKTVVWHPGPLQPPEYCSTWCLGGGQLLDNLRRALLDSKRAIAQAIDDVAYSDEPYAESHAENQAVWRACKDLVAVAYDGIRRLDNLRFHEPRRQQEKKT